MQGLRKILRVLAIILFAGVSLWLFIDAVVNGSGAARKLGVDDSEAGHERAFGKVGLRKPKRRRKTK